MTTVTTTTFDGTTYTTDTDSTSSSSESYDMWITLLATQLQYQDPLDPLDANEMTTQMMNMSALEQQELSNETLTALLSEIETLNNSNSMEYVGKTVTASGDTAPLQDGTCDWTYALYEDAESVTLKVYDLDGNLVFSSDGETGVGYHDFSWDGTCSDGSQATDNAYVLSLDIESEDGTEISYSLSIQGTVTEVNVSDDDDMLLMGDVYIDAEDVLSIKS
jgi:flagellar basal-body rod modification protein FlgD